MSPLLWLSIGMIVIGIIIGSMGVKRRVLEGRTWRPGAGMLALVCLIGAIAAAEMKIIPAAVVLFGVSIWLALNARRRPPRAEPPPRQAPRTSMSLEDAASTLGVPVTASEEEIQAAYVRLMRLVHPDRGGATGLAVQLNRARELMLKARR